MTSGLMLVIDVLWYACILWGADNYIAEGTVAMGPHLGKLVNMNLRGASCDTFWHLLSN